MNRLGIFSIFDKDGVLDETTCQTIQNLRKSVSDLVVVINGSLLSPYLERLSLLADHVLTRPNLGYDSGAYKDVLFHSFSPDSLSEYDELVLCNDTFFGPFIPFSDIFKKMKNAPCDFWGLHYEDHGAVDFIHSYFYCVRSPAIVDGLLPYFQNYIDETTTNIQKVYGRFEMGLFHYLVAKGYRFGTYTIGGNYNIYESGNYFLRETGVPILKRRCFDPIFFNRENMQDALRYIDKTFDYDIDLILQSAKRKYGFTESKEQILTAAPCHPVAVYREVNMVATKETLLDFIANASSIYIYGYGFWGLKIYCSYLQWPGSKMRAFLCSEGQPLPENADMLGVPVCTLSQAKPPLDSSIIVALNSRHTQEVLPALSDYKNLYFLYR